MGIRFVAPAEGPVEVSGLEPTVRNKVELRVFQKVGIELSKRSPYLCRLVDLASRDQIVEIRERLLHCEL